VQSEKFVEDHQGKVNDISIYGQESNQTTWRLAKMNLAIRGIDSSQVKWNNEGSLLNDVHKDLKADFIIANPPFNDGDWSGQLLRKDGRWSFGVPPVSNANFGWVQHFVYHLNPNGIAGFVLADTSLSTVSNDEFEIRKRLIDSNLVDCIVALPSHLFSNTQIAACIWFISRKRENQNCKQVLFIDASRRGKLVTRKNRVLSQNDIQIISDVYKTWKSKINGEYGDIPGLCKSVELDIIIDNNYVISPNRYIEPPKQEINTSVSLDQAEVENQFSRLSDSISELSERVIDKISAEEEIEVGTLYEIEQITQEFNEYCSSLYQALVKEYFIDYNLKHRNNIPPSTWETKSFGEIFKERKLKVKELGFCPPIYSLTNNGIQTREGNFSKDLAKNKDNYKIAFEGDMVFGLSREIPNLDVFKHKQGAFSGAYHIFSPNDIRIGLMIGTIMRLKLMEQTDILKGGAREGRGLDKAKLLKKEFIIPSKSELDKYWRIINR